MHAFKVRHNISMHLLLLPTAFLVVCPLSRVHITVYGVNSVPKAFLLSKLVSIFPYRLSLLRMLSDWHSGLNHRHTTDRRRNGQLVATKTQRVDSAIFIRCLLS